MSDAGFFSGLFHGVVALISLLLDIFWDVEVYQHCQQSWWYDFGFLFGVGSAVMIGLQGVGIAIYGFVIILIAYIIGMLFNLILLGIGIGIGIFLALLAYKWFVPTPHP